jgi:cell division septum initiation protein DivIVA
MALEKHPPDTARKPGPTNGDKPSPRPNLTGDLDTMLSTPPSFRSRVRGYDRLQVDNYVRWAETELTGARREVDDLAIRYGSCLAELQICQQLMARSPEGRQLQQVSERVADLLRLAADEAADLRAAGAEQADRLVGDARAEADALLHRAQEAGEADSARAAKLREDAEAERADADAVLTRARAEVSWMVADAEAERDRLAEQARREREAMLAAAALQVGEMQEEVADLARQREQAWATLVRLSDQIGGALDDLAKGLPHDVRVLSEASDNGSRRHVVAGNGVAGNGVAGNGVAGNGAGQS